MELKNHNTRKRPAPSYNNNNNNNNKKVAKKQRSNIDLQTEKLYSDLKTVSHAVDALYRNFQKIFADTPTIDSYELDPVADQMLHSKSFLFARYLVQEHKNNRIGLFDNLKSIVEGDEFLEHPDPEPATNNTGPISFDDFYKDKVTKYIDRQKAHVPVADSIPKDSVWPPPLPPIGDPILLHKVYTHRSVGKKYTAQTREEEIEVNNERLEFLGDSIINSMFAIIAYEKLPTVLEGDLTACRRQLISNNTLSEWAKMYGMDTELRIDTGFMSMNKYVVGGTNGSANNPKFIADVFEAYVGGLWEYYSNEENHSKAFDVIKPWLESLAEPFFNAIYSQGKCKRPTKSQTQPVNTIVPAKPTEKDAFLEKLKADLSKTDVTYASDTKSQDKNLGKVVPQNLTIMNNDTRSVNLMAKSVLYTKIGKASMRPTYAILSKDPNGDFVVACKMGDDIIATGKGQNTKIAGNRAAMNALADSAVIAKYSAIRRAQNNEFKRNEADEASDKPQESVIDLTSSPDSSPAEEESGNSSHNQPIAQANPIAPQASQSQDQRTGLVLTQQVIQKYTEDPITSLKERLEDLSHKLKFQFKQSDDSQWTCTVCIGDLKVVDGVGSSKRTAKKRASLCALLKHNDVLESELKKA